MYSFVMFKINYEVQLDLSDQSLGGHLTTMSKIVVKLLHSSISQRFKAVTQYNVFHPRLYLEPLDSHTSTYKLWFLFWGKTFKFQKLL